MHGSRINQTDVQPTQRSYNWTRQPFPNVYGIQYLIKKIRNWDLDYLQKEAHETSICDEPRYKIGDAKEQRGNTKFQQMRVLVNN